MATLVPVLLAGGVGSRLWPISREIYPKQLLDLTGGGSLLQQAAERALALAAAEQIITVTTESQYFLVLDQLRDVAEALDRHMVAEPMGRNTAAAVALAAVYASARFDDPVLWVAPADHVIRDRAAMERAVAQARAAAEAGRLVTFGIVPDNPDPGYGYMRRGAPLDGLDGVFAVESFVEKPGRDAAAGMIAAGDCFWNSGMFVFRAEVLLAELAATAPEIEEAVRAAAAAAKDGEAPFRVSAEAYARIPATPIDKAVMERSDRVAVVPVDLGWSDVGSWQRLWEVCDKDENGNVVQGDAVLEETRNTLVRADRRLVACAGIDGLVVVETADAVLVARRDDAAGVKALVERLKAAGRPEANAHLTERRPWGSFAVLLEGARFKIKEIVVKPGAKLSLQMHHHRSEHWVVIEGTARITCDDDVRLISENESTYIPIGARHRLENPGVVPLRIVEVQCGAYVGEDDIVRFEDVYGRDETG